MFACGLWGCDMCFVIVCGGGGVFVKCEGMWCEVFSGT